MNFIKKLFCKHNYKEIDSTCTMWNNGSDKCGKEIFTSIFNKKVN